MNQILNLAFNKQMLPIFMYRTPLIIMFFKNMQAEAIRNRFKD